MLLVLDTNLDRTQTMLTAQPDFGEKKEIQSSGMDGQKCVVGVERPCAIVRIRGCTRATKTFSGGMKYRNIGGRYWKESLFSVMLRPTAT